jgi:hypothetical protein
VIKASTWTVVWRDLETDSIHYTHEGLSGSAEEAWGHFRLLKQRVWRVVLILPGLHHPIIKLNKYVDNP